MHGPDYAVIDMGHDTPCWIWTRGTRNGYGSTSAGEVAHRTLYERAKGLIPEGMVLDHLCRHTLCVNPDHLEAVTSLENHLRASVNIDAEKARNLRRQHVLTIEGLAEAAGLSKNTICNIENSRSKVYPSTVRKLASALGTSPSELLGA